MTGMAFGPHRPSGQGLTLETLLRGIAEETGAPPVYVACTPDTRVTGVTADSRRVREGAAFLAVRGATHDGHEFLAQAREAGASVLLVQRGRAPTVSGAHVVLADTDRAHAWIASNACGRPAERLRLAGVTGTNGKTTTAHLLGAMLESAGRKFARLGTTGNWLVDREERAPFTTPFPLELQTLLATTVERGGTDVAMEVSSHALAQGRVRPLEFHAVGLTSFSQDHLDFHADMDDYLDAKCRLPRDHLSEEGIAVAVVQSQAAAHRFLAEAAERGARAWRASREADPAAEIGVTSCSVSATGTEAVIDTPAGQARIQTPLVGAYNLDNILIAIGLGLGLGLELGPMTRALRGATGAPGRLQRVQVAEVAGPTVVVDYAHTPDAVARTLATLRPACTGRLVVVLGCGGDRDATKRPRMGEVAALGADRFVATSDNPRTEDPENILDQMLAGVPQSLQSRVVREVDRARAILLAIAEASEHDLVLIAGKGHEDYQVLGDQTIHFDDREHAEAALTYRLGTPA
jgi:UDP-N-acetylmuramoyl-L-alanyl-D-glutamate--2,6-diaminopimelate ligase